MTKKPGKDKKPAKPPALKMTTTGTDGRRAAQNVAKIREKLSAAMDDPQMRDQLLRAMRSMMYEDTKE